ncbi:MULTISPECIES: hypothetical protein [unclassified Massilia]|uniref:hypothetical protein n=1 Tax=unclassified Massilia TaxID=2609279 RepID=UPI0017856115|nr:MULTISPECIES: hypothetical protein [unclassified Massilia]MBD8529754.1 hypothetical protein [Massilia sp. CFBP 13647]MBD8672234.1 hypothetical protein [Massilia sp. CFBP 13721]
MKWSFVVLALVGGFAQAEVSMKRDKDGYPLLTQFSEAGFIDCSFRIVDLVENDMEYRFRLIGSYEGERVGMAVTVIKGIRAGMDRDMALIRDHVYRRGVVFSRTGPESDRLVRALARSYGAPHVALQMAPSEAFTVIALHQGEIDMANEPIKLKLFGRDDSEKPDDDYYESFFNLDLKHGYVYWNEKDQDYRAPLLRGLSK